MTPKQVNAKADRAERLAQALRANLKRRKSQARGRNGENAQEAPSNTARDDREKPAK